MEKNKNQEANQDSDVSKHKTYISGTLQLVWYVTFHMVCINLGMSIIHFAWYVTTAVWKLGAENPCVVAWYENGRISKFLKKKNTCKKKYIILSLYLKMIVTWLALKIEMKMIQI
jgi:hypothetical protein